MLKKIRFYISPYFLIRYYIQRDVMYFIKKYKFKGRVLDFGCGQKQYEQLFGNSEYTGIDFKDYSKNRDAPDKKPDIFFGEEYSKDLALPFDNESFDHAVSFQVLEHHKSPEKMISEMARTTKGGGFVLISCPFIFGLHEEPNDFQRYTKYKLEDLFKKNNCEVIERREEGSLFSVISMLLNEHIGSFAAKNNLCYFLAVFIYLPFLLFQYASLLFDKIIKSEKIFINYMILARKNK
ncbi:MAG: methyltransferase domain-containing protein [Parcubacteria group bacterium]